MTRLIEEDSPLHAWQAATESLLAAPGHRLFGLVVRISQPTNFVEADLTRFDRVIGCREGTTRLVARTIMPRSVVDAGDWNRAATRLITRLSRRGSYFRRMVAYEEGPNVHNQLERTIISLRRHGTVDPGPVILEKPTRLSASHRGFPCLSSIQFHRDGARLLTTAVYRSHYYAEKAFGNFIGLGRLVELVCKESSFSPAELTVISTDARISLPQVGLMREATRELSERRRWTRV